MKIILYQQKQIQHLIYTNNKLTYNDSCLYQQLIMLFGHKKEESLCPHGRNDS